MTLCTFIQPKMPIFKINIFCFSNNICVAMVFDQNKIECKYCTKSWINANGKNPFNNERKQFKNSRSFKAMADENNVMIYC